MKNYEEFKGYRYRVEFDAVSQTFVSRRLDEETMQQDGATSSNIAPIHEQQIRSGCPHTITDISSKTQRPSVSHSKKSEPHARVAVKAI
jgi:hypothetical protein